MIDRVEIIRLVEEKLGFTPTAETKFFWGTGVAGLDAWAFMEEFAKRYGIDMDGAGEGFDYGDSEGGIGDAIEHLWRRLTFRSVPTANHFTIDHLVEVANRKKWFDPVTP